MLEQRKFALRERVLRTIAGAHRMKWIHIERDTIAFSIAIQIHSAAEIDKIPELQLSETIDRLYKDGVYCDSDLIWVCDKLYEHIADLYNQHDIHIDVVILNQPVLSTTYLNK